MASVILDLMASVSHTLDLDGFCLTHSRSWWLLAQILPMILVASGSVILGPEDF